MPGWMKWVVALLLGVGIIVLGFRLRRADSQEECYYPLHPTRHAIFLAARRFIDDALAQRNFFFYEITTKTINTAKSWALKLGLSNPATNRRHKTLP